MYVEEFRDVVMTSIRVLLSEGCSDGCGFLLDERAFVCDGLNEVNSVVGDGNDER